MTTAPDKPSLPRAALAGVPATIAMDVWARTVARVLGIDALGPGSLGRWIGHMRRGRFAHQDIAAAPPIPNEAAIGIVTHYAIGLTLGLGYGLLVRATAAQRSTLPRALAYGTATTIFPWFVLFPATGGGVMGRRENTRLAALSLCNHAVYGLALGAATKRLARPATARSRGPGPVTSQRLHWRRNS
jgi:Protein of unknown function (DUF2938)/Family of unknown function (DUF6789)